MNIPPLVLKDVDEFFAEKTCSDINRSTYLVCNLRDIKYQITISLVFMRDWDSLETDSYNQVVIEKKGAVFTFPGYWVSIPKELAIPYITYVLEDFYTNHVASWFGNDSSDFGGSDGSNCNCPCGVI